MGKKSKKLKRMDPPRDITATGMADLVPVPAATDPGWPREIGYAASGTVWPNLGWHLPNWSWVNDPSMILNAADALSVTAAWRAVSLVGGVLGSVPLHAFRDDERIEEPRLLERPEVDWDFASTMMRMVHDLLLSGEFYALTDRDRTVDNTVDQLFLLSAPEVEVRRVNGRLAYRFHGQDLPADEVARTTWMARPGYDRGIGLVEMFGDKGLSFARTIQEYAKSTFADSAVPSVVIKTDDPDQTFQEAQELKNGWMNQFRGKREPAVLNSADLTPLSFSPESAQLAIMWDQAVKEVALMTGIPARYFSLEVSSMTYSTIESERRDLIDLGIMPFANRIERFFSDLLPRGQKARFIFDAFLRGNTTERYQTYEISARVEQMTGQPILSHEEIRELEHRKPLPEPEPMPVPTQLTLIPAEEEAEAS